MGAALRLLIAVLEHGVALLFGLLCTVLPMVVGFDAMVHAEAANLGPVIHAAVAFMLHVNWETVLRQSLIPHLSHAGPY